jgi:hypothetical protein
LAGGADEDGVLDWEVSGMVELVWGGCLGNGGCEDEDDGWLGLMGRDVKVDGWN